MKLLKQIAGAFLLCALILSEASAENTMSLSTISEPVDSNSFSMKYGKKGFEFRTLDNKFALQIRTRLQFRFLTPYPSNPRTINAMNADPITTFRVNRARLKVGGHGYQPWLKYYFEYEVGQNRLLNFTLKIEKFKKFSVVVGQWKTDYSRERRISSGKQMMVDRSIINRPFTLDRQQGIAFYGHFEGHGAANIKYWVSILTGTGRSSRRNDDNKLMYVGRLQWNVLNGGTDMSGSDLKISPKPRLSLAVGAATNTSSYTRFSSGGPGQLRGFSEGAPGQYEVNQGVAEVSFKYKGFSLDHEYHVKEVNDKIENHKSELKGYYVQAGYFFHQAMDWVPEPLEIAFRYADYTPNTEIPSAFNNEFTTSVNWFFKGHNNKLSADFGYFTITDVNGNSDNASRVRLQWDISF
jgi:phosphate-selective porin OprO and OprP